MPRMRLVPFAALALLAACAQQRATDATTPEEDRLLAYLARDPYVVIERSERDADGNLLVVTVQGRRHVRYLIAPDDPARPELRLRRMQDESGLDIAPNPHPGGERDAGGRR